MRPACEAALQVAKADQVAVPARAVPQPLRRLLRFARLNATALATVRRVLDEDEAFRAHVSAAVDLDALREGGAAASALFLARPEGWDLEVAALAGAAADSAAAAGAERADAAAGRRLEVVEVALAKAEAELGALRHDARSWRAKAEAERRARRTAESDVGRLRKRVADLERDAAGRAAADDGDAAARDAALAAAETRAAQAEARATAARVEAADARAALAAATAPEAGAGPQAAPSPRVDHAAVTAAVDAAVAAVGSLAEALGAAARALSSEPATAPAPAPAAGALRSERRRRPRPGGRLPPRTPEPLPPAVFEDEVAAAEHLLRVPGVLVLVDGYNVTITSRGGASLPDQRRWLLDAAAGAAARTGAEFLVVFDGHAEGGAPGDASRRRGVSVRFTDADVEADDEVLALLADLAPGRPAVVVSDDHRVRGGARRLGANVVGVDQLVAAMRC